MFLRHANRAVTVGIVAPLEVLATVSTILRFFTRRRISKIKLQADDYMVLVAVVTQNILGIATLIEFTNGIGLHRSTLDDDPHKLIVIKKVQYVAAWLSMIDIMLVKVSIILLYRRIFSLSRLRLACDWLMAIIVVYTTITTLEGIFLCSPIDYYWTQIHKDRVGSCLKREYVLFGFSAADMATNIVIVFLPMCGLRGLTMAKRKRYSLIALFAVSLMPCVAAAVRTSVVRFTDAYDFSYYFLDMCLWSAVELTVACICANIPTLTPLLLRHFPGLFEDGPSDIRSLQQSHSLDGFALGSPFDHINAFRIQAPAQTKSSVDFGCGGAKEVNMVPHCGGRSGSGVDSVRDLEKGMLYPAVDLRRCCSEPGERA